MDAPRIIVVGGSAGSIAPLMTLVGQLPGTLPAAVFVVVHLPAGSRSRLPEILSRAGPLPALHARDAEPIRAGRIYVAPPDRHLLLRPGGMALRADPRENGQRPALDPLFRSAAEAFGPRVIGVVLSGALGDGAGGLEAIKAHGGTAIVQDPDEAAFSGMPDHALAASAVDLCLSSPEIGLALTRLVREPTTATSTIPAGPNRREESSDPVARDFDCPACGGALEEQSAAGSSSFRCRVGHRYSALALARSQDESLEHALWAAVRALEERSDLSRRLAARVRSETGLGGRRRLLERAEEARAQAEVIRQLFEPPSTGPRPSEVEPAGSPVALNDPNQSAT